MINLLSEDVWKTAHRPGYFGKRKAEKIAELNQRFGEGNWKLAHVVTSDPIQGDGKTWVFDFVDACKTFYEESYYIYFKDRPQDIEYATQFKECYDNDPSNMQCGCDYSKQESVANHIQDIALRNVLRRLGKSFLGTNGGYMQVRSKDTAGARFSPYNVPFAWPHLITQPSMAPDWAPHGTVEDFWQSNKWVLVKT